MNWFWIQYLIFKKYYIKGVNCSTTAGNCGSCVSTTTRSPSSSSGIICDCLDGYYDVPAN